tara:strand:+ start:257 stop:463 length:207 start_codon:yes stop_codon:yes gene_type:complete
MKKLIGRLYWQLSNRIGYIITVRDYYDPKTFTLRKNNTHLVLFKIVSDTDDAGWRKLEEVYRIQIKKI